MSLKRNEINPLSVLGLRILNFIPEHFSRVVHERVSFHDIELIDNWINYNLNGRYAIIDTLKINQNNNKIQDFMEIGMEDPKELTMFMLGCPHIKNERK